MLLLDISAKIPPTLFQIKRYEISALSFSVTLSRFHSLAKHVDMQNISLGVQKKQVKK